jgi:hypothetical protein
MSYIHTTCLLSGLFYAFASKRMKTAYVVLCALILFVNILSHFFLIDIKNASEWIYNPNGYHKATEKSYHRRHNSLNILKHALYIILSIDCHRNFTNCKMENIQGIFLQYMFSHLD